MRRAVAAVSLFVPEQDRLAEGLLGTRRHSPLPPRRCRHPRPLAAHTARHRGHRRVLPRRSMACRHRCRRPAHRRLRRRRHRRSPSPEHTRHPRPRRLHRQSGAHRSVGPRPRDRRQAGRRHRRRIHRRAAHRGVGPHGPITRGLSAHTSVGVVGAHHSAAAKILDGLVQPISIRRTGLISGFRAGQRTVHRPHHPSGVQTHRRPDLRAALPVPDPRQGTPRMSPARLSALV